MTFLIFKDRNVADALLAETPFAPESGVILKVGPTPENLDPADPNADFLTEIGEPGADVSKVTFCEGADGRVFLNPVYLTEEDVLALQTWHSAAIASGNLVIAEALPDDWAFPEIEP